MVLTDEELNTRLESPANLMNRLSKISQIPCLPTVVEDGTANYVDDITGPSADDLIDNLEAKLAESRITKSSLAVLEATVNQLQGRLCEVEKPERLSRIATDMSKVIDSFRPKKDETKSSTPIIMYRPVMINESRYESVIAHD